MVEPSFQPRLARASLPYPLSAEAALGWQQPCPVQHRALRVSFLVACVHVKANFTAGRYEAAAPLPCFSWEGS